MSDTEVRIQEAANCLSRMQGDIDQERLLGVQPLYATPDSISASTVTNIEVGNSFLVTSMFNNEVENMLNDRASRPVSTISTINTISFGHAPQACEIDRLTG